MIKPIGLPVWGDDYNRPSFAILWLTEDIAANLLYLMDEADELSHALIDMHVGMLSLMHVVYSDGIRWYREPDGEDLDLLCKMVSGDVVCLPSDIDLDDTEEEEEIDYVVCVVTPRSVCWKGYAEYGNYGNETTEITRIELEGMKW